MSEVLALAVLVVVLGKMVRGADLVRVQQDKGSQVEMIAAMTVVVPLLVAAAEEQVP
jgi:hypothetical protein